MTYTPRRGSTAAVMLAALQQVDSMTSAELAAAGGVRTKAIYALMAGAIAAGMVEKTMEGDRARFRWRGDRSGSLPIPPDLSALPNVLSWPFLGSPAPVAGPESERPPTAHEDDSSVACEFAIALWHDGELDIFGAGEIEQNGVPGVRLNCDQVAQLRGLLNRVSLACHQHPSSGVGPGLPELVMPGWSRRAGSLPTRENGHQE